MQSQAWSDLQDLTDIDRKRSTREIQHQQIDPNGMVLRSNRCSDNWTAVPSRLHRALASWLGILLRNGGGRQWAGAMRTAENTNCAVSIQSGPKPVGVPWLEIHSVFGRKMGDPERKVKFHHPAVSRPPQFLQSATAKQGSNSKAKALENPVGWSQLCYSATASSELRP